MSHKSDRAGETSIWWRKVWEAGWRSSAPSPTRVLLPHSCASLSTRSASLSVPHSVPYLENCSQGAGTRLNYSTELPEASISLGIRSPGGGTQRSLSKPLPTDSPPHGHSCLAWLSGLPVTKQQLWQPCRICTEQSYFGTLKQLKRGIPESETEGHKVWLKRRRRRRKRSNLLMSYQRKKYFLRKGSYTIIGSIEMGQTCKGKGEMLN